MAAAHDTWAIALPTGERVTLRAALAHQLALLEATGVPDARHVLAREHYFHSWDDAQAHGDRVIDRRFEAAADAIVAGDLARLARELAADPALARARSAYDHHQTLLQHVAANGIEMARQRQTPPTACELAHVLLTAGAEPDVTCDSYGHRDTALAMLCSSMHPAAAGLQAALVDTLVRGGARVDGPDDDSAPLWTAIIWGYGAAVDALVRCGAGIDHLVHSIGGQPCLLAGLPY